MSGLDALTSNPSQDGSIEIDGDEYSFETTPPTRAELTALDDEHDDDVDQSEWAYIFIREFLDSFDGETVDDAMVDDIPMPRALLLHQKMQEAWTTDIQAAFDEMEIEGNP